MFIGMPIEGTARAIENRDRMNVKPLAVAALAVLVMFGICPTRSAGQQLASAEAAHYPSSEAKTPEEKGLAVALESDMRDSGFGDFEADMQMILRNRHGQESSRKLRTRTLEMKEDGDKSLVIFDTPRDVNAYARDVALADPRLINFLIPEKANVTGVNVTLNFTGEDPRENEAAVAAARELVARIEGDHPNVQVYLTGFAMLNNAFQEASMKDMATLTPLMYLGIFLTMGFLLRSVTGTFSTAVIIAISAGGGVGLAGGLDIPITPPSSAAPTVIMTLAVADSIHILVTMLQQMRRSFDKHGAIVESLRLNLQPVFLTSLTTVIGFLSMNFSDVPPLRDLGNITAMGVTIAFLFSITLLPAMMAVFPVRVKQRATSQTVWLDRFSDWVVGRRRPLLWGSLVVVVALGAFVPRNDLNDQFVKYFDESIAFRRDTDFAMKHLSGIYQIEYSIEAGRSQGISDPAYLERLDAFDAWFRRQEGVIHVNTISETMKRLNMSMHEDDPSYLRLPENPELSAQYLLLYEMSLTYGQDLNNQIKSTSQRRGLL